MEGEMQFETAVELFGWQFVISVLIVILVTIGISWLVRALPIRQVVVGHPIIITLKVPISFERGNVAVFILPVCLFETGVVIRRGAPLPLDDAPELAEQLSNLLNPIATKGFMFSHLIVSSIRRVGNQVEVVVAYSPAGSSTRILPDEFVTHFEKWCSILGTGWQMQGSLPPIEPSVDHNKCDAVESGSPVIA